MFTTLNKIRVIGIGLVIVTLVLLSITLITPTAHAQDQTLSGFCPFDVDLTILQAANLKTHETKDGILITTGALKVQLANASTGETLDLNISGPGKFIPGPNGTQTQIFLGPWLLGVPEGVLPDFPLRLFFSRGRVVATTAEDGLTFTSLTIQGGNVIDICAELSQ